MKNLREVLKNKIKDETAVYAILIAMIITYIGAIGINEYIKYNQSWFTSASITNNKGEETFGNTESIENLPSVKDVNNIEDLKKLNEKELEEAKKKQDKDKKEKNDVDSTPQYYIKVNYGAQVVTVYAKDSKGKYTKPVKAMACSTGTYTPTSGVYSTPNRFRWLDMLGDVYAQYCTQIVGDILFHSVPYLTKYDNSSLEYWAYDKLGTRASLGCIRLTCRDAKWIYDNCRLGTQVEFYSSSDPGPLGKPSTRKISDAPSYVRGWDPTDPAKGNPWGKYLKDKNNKKPTKPTTPTKPDIPSKPSASEEPMNEVINEVINEVVSNEVNEIVDFDTNVTINEVGGL